MQKTIWVDEDGYGWHKPFTSKKFGTEENKSCWDCKFLTVGHGMGRICSLHKKKHIFSPQTGDEEKEKWGDTVANKCPDYTFDVQRIK